MGKNHAGNPYHSGSIRCLLGQDAAHPEAAANNHREPSRAPHRLRAEHHGAPHLDHHRAVQLCHRRQPSLHYEHGVFTTDTSTGTVTGPDWHVMLEHAFARAWPISEARGEPLRSGGSAPR